MDKPAPIKDRFNNFAALARHKKEGKDYTVTVREVPRSNVAIVVPHGGNIEGNTAEIATVMAANDHNLYIFRALEGSGGFAEMHITSTHFDEPRCLALIAKTDVTLTIHGSRIEEPVVCLSSMDKKLESKLAAAFNKAGIKTLIAGHPYQGGKRPENICNKNRKKQGVQLEFSTGIRNDPALREKCIKAVRDTLRF